MYEIEQLHSDDFEQAIDFINMVFSMEVGPTNFAEMLPAYYKPDEAHMSCHYAIRDQGHIRALLGIYPIELKLGDTTLRVARVGAVSTHPFYQGRGMMRTLMSYSTELIKSQYYHLAVLGGLRHRYLRFGYEKCGTKMSFSINTAIFRKQTRGSNSLWVERIAGDDATVINRLLQLHNAQLMHASRDGQNFLDTCKNWNGELYVAWNHTHIAGYLVSNATGSYIYELVAEHADLEAAIIAAFAAANQNEFINVELPPLAGPLMQRMHELCEEAVIKPANSWLVLDWESVIGGLLHTKSKTTSLLTGEIVLGINDYGNVQVSVGGSGIRCSKTEQQADLNLTATEMMRVLFGPLPPQFVTGTGHYAETPSAEKAALLQSWCPLPLYLGTPDCA